MIVDGLRERLQDDDDDLPFPKSKHNPIPAPR